MLLIHCSLTIPTGHDLAVGCRPVCVAVAEAKSPIRVQVGLIKASLARFAVVAGKVIFEEKEICDNNLKASVTSSTDS